MSNERDRAQELFDALSSTNRIRSVPGGVEIRDNSGTWQRINAGSAQGTEQVIRTRRTRPREEIITTQKVMVLTVSRYFTAAGPPFIDREEYYLAGDRPEPILIHTIQYSGIVYSPSTVEVFFPPVDLHRGYIASDSNGNCIIEIRHSRTVAAGFDPDDPRNWEFVDPEWINSYAYRVTGETITPIPPGTTWRGAITHFPWNYFGPVSPGLPNPCHEEWLFYDAVNIVGQKVWNTFIPPLLYYSDGTVTIEERPVQIDGGCSTIFSPAQFRNAGVFNLKLLDEPPPGGVIDPSTLTRYVAGAAPHLT